MTLGGDQLLRQRCSSTFQDYSHTIKILLLGTSANKSTALASPDFSGKNIIKKKIRIIIIRRKTHVWFFGVWFAPFVPMCFLPVIVLILYPSWPRWKYCKVCFMTDYPTLEQPGKWHIWYFVARHLLSMECTRLISAVKNNTSLPWRACAVVIRRQLRVPFDVA